MLCSGVAPCAARGYVIRVGLAFEVEACRLSSAEGLELADADGQHIAGLPDAVTAVIASSGGVAVGGRTYTQPSLMVRPRNGAIALNGRWYRGQMVLLRSAGGRLNVVNYVDLESYIQGVLAGEVPSSWPEECLKAQAVAARSYVLHQVELYGGRDWDVVATDRDQVYEGMAGEIPSIVRAVQATRREVIAYNGKVVKAYFHSACGGHTEAASVAFGEDAPYMQGVTDPYCERSPYQAWTREYTMQHLRRAISQGSRSTLGKVLEVRLGKRAASGRAEEIVVVREGGDEKLAGTELRRLLGYRDLRSTFFDIKVKKSVLVTVSTTQTQQVAANDPAPPPASEEPEFGLEQIETVNLALKPEEAFHVISGSGALDKARAGYAYAATSEGVLRTFAMRPGLEAVGLAHRLVAPRPVVLPAATRTNPEPRPRTVTVTRLVQRQVPLLLSFQGRGWGHGVGMCQWGARGMAAHGMGYREILSWYYPTTRLMIVTN